MDILENLTADYDVMRDLIRNFETTDDEMAKASTLRQLSLLSQASVRAEAAALYMLPPEHEALQTLKLYVRKMFSRSDLMEKLAVSAKNNQIVSGVLFNEMLLGRLYDAEHTLLPQLFELCSESELVEMGQEYARYRDTALGPDAPMFHAAG